MKKINKNRNKAALHFYESIEEIEEGDRVKLLTRLNTQETYSVMGVVLEKDEEGSLVYVEWAKPGLDEWCDYSLLVKMPNGRASLRVCAVCGNNLTRHDTKCNISLRAL